MNHRYGSRLAVHIDVVIHQQGKQLGQYQTRDISPYGVFLETGTLDLHLGTSVNLTFILSDQPEERRKIKGLVVRRSFDGAGLMLSDHYRQIFLRLKQQGLETLLTGTPDDTKDLGTDKILSLSEKSLVSGEFLDKAHIEEKLMEKTTKSHRDSDGKITIQARKSLDCSAHSTFTQACRSAEKNPTQAIVVDLNATRNIRASGLGMLLMLRNEAKALDVEMSFENCNPDIKSQLHSSRLLNGLSIF